MEHKCKYIKREGASCFLNNNCKYPNCDMSNRKKFIYKEDNQGYYFMPFIFETNARISAKAMSKISWEKLGAGRVSTSFSQFQNLMKKKGFQCILIKTGIKNTLPSSKLQIVEGATGNY